MSNPKRRKNLVVFSFSGIVRVGWRFYPFFKKRGAVITMKKEKTARRNLTETVVANGKIQPVLQVKISPEVSGEIIVLAVKEGQDVKKGDLLLKIKPDFYVAHSGQAEASYKSPLARQPPPEPNLPKAA